MSTGFLKVDHDQAQQGRYMPPAGDYECVISDAKYDKTKRGTEYLHITLTIRDDVEQEGQGENIDWAVWKKKDPTKRDPGGFALGTIQQISRVTKLPNGKDYATIDDWMSEIIHKPLKVTINHEEFNGRTNARVGFMYETDFPQLSDTMRGFIDVDDMEDPF